MRGFVIGNGPSLNRIDLNVLRDEYTVGCNRFDLLDLDWNPTVWVLADVIHEDGWWDWDDLLYRDSEFYFKQHDREYLDPKFLELPNIHFRPPCLHNGSPRYPVTGWHLPETCDYGGSIGWGLQLAAMARANPIYLLGCDLYKYRGRDDVDINHFHPEYCPYKWSEKRQAEINTPEAWERLNERLVHSHEIARDSAKAMGIDIFNATDGGALEVYPRVNFSEIGVASGKAEAFA